MRYANKILFFSLLLAARPGCAAEFEVIDKLVANGATTLKSSATIVVPDTQSASLWASTSAVTPHLFVSTAGNIGVGTAAPDAKLEVAGQVKITGGTPGAGKVLTSDGAGLATWETAAAAGDNLGNHVATTTLKMGNYALWSSSSITAARYQINGSTVLARMPGTSYSLGVGVNAGRVATGEYNSFVGANAGYSNNTGEYNSFLGYQAGYNNTTASQNVFLGGWAGYTNNTGTANLFAGYAAGRGNTTGFENSFAGHTAGYTNSTGYNNSFFGSAAGYTNSTGYQNSFIGDAAGYDNSTGYENTFVGWVAGRYNTEGWYNSFLGAWAGWSNTTGNNSSILGHSAAYYNQTGSANAILGDGAGYGVSGNSFSNAALVGHRAGYGLTTGSDNIFLGWQAGYNTTSGARNIIIGYDQRASAPAVSNELNIGGVLYGDLSAKTIGISTRVPQAALDIVSTGTLVSQYAQIWRNSGGTVVASMTATGKLYTAVPPAGDNLGDHVATTTLKMGNYAIWSSSDVNAAHYQIGGNTVLAKLAGTGSLGVGELAGAANSGSYNVFAGQAAGTANTTGAANSFVGYYAGATNSTGNGNSFMGEQAGYLNDTGYQNSFFGLLSGQTNAAGAANTFMGAYSGNDNTASFNSLIGAYAGYSNTTGDNNSIVGYNAGYYTKTGQYNAILGAEAGYGVLNNSFSNAVLMGYKSGYGLTTGSDNILLGFQAGDSLTTGARNIVIGYDQDAITPATSNSLNLGGLLYGNLSAKTIGISTRVPQAALDIVSTGTLISQYAQIWRDSTGLAVASMTATGKLYTAVPPAGDNLGDHIAEKVLDMAGKAVINVSSLTVTAPDTVPAALWVSTSVSTPHLYVSTSGNVGIGTANPGAMLDVRSDAAIGGALAVDGNIRLGDSTGDITGINRVPETGVALSVDGDGTGGSYVVKFYSGGSLAGWIRKK